METVEQINTFLVEEFEVDASKIKPEANLKETLGLDSLDYIDLVVLIEGNLGIKVDPDDFVDIITFQDFYNYVIKHLHSKELA
jgi:acyl carrier protein